MTGGLEVRGTGGQTDTRGATRHWTPWYTVASGEEDLPYERTVYSKE